MVHVYKIATGKGGLDVLIDTSISTVVLRRRPAAPPPLLTNVTPVEKLELGLVYVGATQADGPSYRLGKVPDVGMLAENRLC